MTTSYKELKPAIISIIVESNKNIQNRLQEKDCQDKLSRNAIVGLGIEGEDLISTLSAIMNANKNKEIHPDYQEDIKNIGVFLERLQKDERFINDHNEKTEQVRELIVAEMESNREEAIKKLTDGANMYRVHVEMSKLTKDEAFSLIAAFENKGFEKVVDSSFKCYFDGLFKGTAEKLNENIISVLSIPSKGYEENLKSKIKIESISYTKALREEVNLLETRRSLRMR